MSNHDTFKLSLDFEPQEEQLEQKENILYDNTEDNQTYNTINKGETTNTVPTSEVNMINIDMNIEKYYPYDNVNEIPELKIKDENLIMINKELKPLKPYIDILEKWDKEKEKSYDDLKFSQCKNCRVNKNTNFCIQCKKNFCPFCARNCKNNDHNIIMLEKMENDVKNAKEYLRKMIIKGIKTESPKEKSPTIYDLSQSHIAINKDDDFPTIKCDIPNDIELLISRIIGKNYINYIHYNNILECYNYISSKYESCFEKNCLLIHYDVKKWEEQSTKKNKEEEEDEEEEEEENGEKKKIQIFGEYFVENNKDKLFLIINNKRSKLVAKTKVDDDYLEVILVENSNNYITNLSCMFKKCKYLTGFNKFKGHDLVNFEYVTDISCMFKDCSKIEKLDLELFSSFQNIKNMENLFYGCKELKEIKYIQNWNTSEVTNMNGLFYGCQKLKDMNFLKYFKTNKVMQFIKMFSKCEALEIIPEIKDWNMEKAENLRGMFKKCIKLKEPPDVSNWNLKNVLNMSQMFSGCLALENSPDFSEIEFDNLENLNGMFKDCTNLKKKPKFKKWKFKKKGKLTYKNIFLITKK